MSKVWMRCLVLLAVWAVGCNEQQPLNRPVTGEGRRQAALSGPPTFVQVAFATPQSASASVSVKFAAAQSSGDLNVVVVGWNDATSTITTVSDTSGNSYALAAGPTVYPGALSQAIYVAKSIAPAAANANTVRVTFNTAASFVDVRILEYAGLHPTDPIEASAAAIGTATTADSGPLTTTTPNDLLVAANMTTDTTTGPGSGFTRRVITTPDSDIAEDRVATTTGSYRGTATVTAGSRWIMQMVALRPVPGDTAPPSVPGTPTVVGSSDSRLDLSWGAASDNVGVAGYRLERCQGSGCSSFVQIAALAGTATTYSDTGLTPATTYGYRVRAVDAAGNLGPYSATGIGVTPADTTPPGAPASLTATAAGTSQVNVAWSAASDDVGVAGYRVERCTGSGCSSFAEIVALGPGASVYSDIGLAAGSTYGYRVRAVDAAGNLGSYSAVATATTQAPDTQPPTVPGGVSAVGSGTSQVTLSWTASTDNVGVSGYPIERCQGSGCSNFAVVASAAAGSTSFVDSGLSTATSYSYRISAVDAAGNSSGPSAVTTATTLSTPPRPVVPAFVQGNFATPQSSPTSVTVPYKAAQTAGNLNVVVVGWNDATTSVSTVRDTSGSTYSLAIGPTRQSGGVSQSIYYAPNIAAAAAGVNKVTVTFSTGAAFPDVRVLEYGNVARTSPLDAATGATGNSATSSSGALSVPTAYDLLVGANTVQTTTDGAGPGYALRMITTPDSDLVEDRVVTTAGSNTATAPLGGAGGWVMQLVAFKPGPPDATPPTVSITSPAAGATLSATATINVQATDPESAVTSIQLLVDGVVALSSASNPVSFRLDTRPFANGAHQLSASAVSGGPGSGYAAAVPVTFSNTSPGNPAVNGVWTGTITLPLVPVHVSQLPGGQILMHDAQGLYGMDAWTWDTSNNTFLNVEAPANIFCSGHEQMADGRVLVVGGHIDAHIGLSVANAFDPTTGAWSVLPDMGFPRWYPTATTLPDGRILVQSGESNCNGCYVATPEIYNPSTNAWSKLSSAQFSFTYYPHGFVLPDGRILVSSTAESPIQSQVLDLGALRWSAIGGGAVEGGTAAMYLPGKILKTGTSVDPDTATRNSTALAYVLDTTTATPSWRQVGSMNFPRTYVTLTLLPDGTVLATGGGPTTAATDTARATLVSELWSPTTETWTKLGAMHAPRLYHSGALLMPDGRVLVLGGGRFDNATVSTDQFNGEFFAPPYLFKGPQPTISSAPGSIPYAQPFTLQTPDAARIAKVSLMRFASTTHAINMGQRYVPLSFTTGSGSLTVTGPANRNVATPGNYMLFLVDTSGVPSLAATVRL